MDIQIGVIKRNIQHFEKGFDKHAKTVQKKQVAEKFIQRCTLDKIRQTDLIIKDHRKMSAHFNSCRQIDERIEEGTFNDRIKAQKSRQEQVQHLKNQLSKLVPSWLLRCRLVEWTPVPHLKVGLLWPLNLIKGRPFDAIQSSKFCPSKAIALYRDSFQDYCMANEEEDNLMKKRKIEHQLLKDMQDIPLLKELTMLYPEILSSLESNNAQHKTFVLKSPYFQHDLLKNCHYQQHEFIDQIMGIGKEIQRGQHMIILNWPLLTRVHVALFFIIADHFEEVGFIKPVQNCHGVFFSEFKGDFKHEETLKNVQNINSTDLLSILPVTELAKEPIYSMIVAHNINVMRESSIYHLQATH